MLIPPNNQYNLAQMLVPIDDVNCMFYWIAWHPTQGIAQDEWRRFCAAEVAASGIEPPAIVVIGEVVRLRAALDWLGASEGRILIPDPLGTRQQGQTG